MEAERPQGQESAQRTSARRYPAGAEILGNAVSFRVFAPACEAVSVVLEGGMTHVMQAEERGYFRIDIKGLGAGTRYRLRLQGVDDLLSDPASRFQPDGPDGPSMVVDSSAYRWRDTDWAGVRPANQVLYEMHVGTFTPEGTYAAAAAKLSHLRDIGITCLEMMPVNEFRGTFGWGYDGILPYAPTRLYGEPDELRAFIDAAHGLGIGVILDVVYNHFGNGDRFRAFTPDYFTDRYDIEWGDPINFDGPNAHGVREFFAANAAYWIDEFHFDGLRLDATQALFDSSTPHIIADIAARAREAGGERAVYLVAENEPQDTALVRAQAEQGHGLDALWNDDFHHSATVALTGRNEAYYHDHRGKPQEFVSAAKYGYLFQGQRYDWQDAPRGQPGFDLDARHFIHFIQNHDQIANSGTGKRIDKLTSPARLRAMTALLLLGPQTPMLFQGQEFASSAPFFYFADHPGEFGELVRKGRGDFLRQFPSVRDPAIAGAMADPSARETFERSKLDWREVDAHHATVVLHRDLLRLRRECPVLGGNGRSSRGSIDGSVLSDGAFLLRYFAEKPEDERLLLVNLGSDLELTSLPDPLFAPAAGFQWQVEWSSEDPTYGGTGRRPMDLQARFTVTGESAVLLSPCSASRRPQPDGAGMQAWQDSITC